MSESTAKECLAGAFQAILRGDYAERDRLCERGRVLTEIEDYAYRIERVMQADFYVNTRGTAYPTRSIARAEGVLQ